MGYHIICSYDGKTGQVICHLQRRKRKAWYGIIKCTFTGIILDWLEDDASYDLVGFCQEVCDLFAGSGEKALLKCAEDSSTDH